MSEEKAAYDVDRLKDIKFLWECEKSVEVGMKPSNYVCHNDIGWLIQTIEQQQQKIKSLTNAKITFVNNGWEEERYSLQEEIERMRKVLVTIREKAWDTYLPARYVKQLKDLVDEGLKGGAS